VGAVSKGKPDAEAPVTEPPPEPEPEPPEPITVRLGNSRRIGARSCSPGDLVTLPADEARELIREGHAVRVP
jgi:hypothetical protein